MSRTRRLGTVVRVADLRVGVARGQAAAAAARTVAARTEEQHRTAVLAAGAPVGLDLSAVAQLLALRAAAVRGAGEAVATADRDRAGAVEAHVAASRRARLLTQLADRLRAEDELRRIADDQRTSDDSTSARHSRKALR